jgi:5-methylthioadenosine/S-adenosylhomocysteine deaminase
MTSHDTETTAGGRQTVDLIVEGRWVLPMTEPGGALDRGLVAIRAGRIAWVGPADAGHARFHAPVTVGDSASIVLPGLINAHTHVGDHIYGTLCDEADLTDTLYEVIFPLAGAVDADIMHAAARLGLWDAARSGVTTVCDLNMYADANARAAAEVGMRAVMCEKIVGYRMDATPVYDRAARRFEMHFDRAEAERLLAIGVEFIERWRGHDLITPCLGPHSADHLPTEMLCECARLADELDVKMIPHVSATTAELAEIRHRGHEGTIRYLDAIGFLSPRVHAAHMVFVDDEEIALAADRGISMSFNPTSMLASRSFPPIDKLQRSGMTIGFGTDAFSMDPLKDMRYAIYAANLLCGGEAGALRARDLIHMATAGGARAIGLADEIGTLEAGKRADMAVVSLRDGQLAAATEPHEALAYLASSRDVTHTIVGGEVICERGRLTRLDADVAFAEGRAATAEWLSRNRSLLDRSGLSTRIAPELLHA